MTHLVHDLIVTSAARRPQAPALAYRGETLTYTQLQTLVSRITGGLLEHGLGRGDRVCVYLEKRFETVAALFATAAAGGCFVPVNPLLRPRQVHHILADSGARILVTSRDRLTSLALEAGALPDLKFLVVVDDGDMLPVDGFTVLPWSRLAAGDAERRPPHRILDGDMTAILYTSGSTGSPKGVVLSHRNIAVGAASVGAYLNLSADDRILSVLPLSFDYGLNQFTGAFHAGASVAIINYLLPADVIRAVVSHRITGLGCVPTLWTQLSTLPWPEEARRTLRYITNTGGAMPGATLKRLRTALPDTDVYLMYGLTEAFRSTFLPPDEVDRRPDSIGKAIPNAEVLVVREDGSLCDPDEPGELVHRGPLVALGYWNDPGRTAERFRPAPGRPEGLPIREIAVWSGDTVRRDADGFLYFIGRRDEMIKTSGYRVSPTEVEEIVHASGMVGDAAAFGVPHPILGEAIVVAVTAAGGGTVNTDAVREACRRDMPAYLVPLALAERPSLPRNPNGKVDRKALSEEYRSMFSDLAP